MKLVLLFALTAAVSAAHLDHLDAATKPPIPILRLDSLQSDDGSFQYGYETANKIKTEVQGWQQLIGENIGTVMEGSYSYVNPEGQNIKIDWVADENGFRAFGDTLPL